MKATTEAAFETLIVDHLLEHGGYVRREPKDFGLDLAVLRATLARDPQKNLSYFAFTATPKLKTLELFGHKNEDG